MSKDAPKKSTLNQKIAELDKKVEWFYSDDFSLEKAIENYEQATNLAQEIEKDLQTLQNKIEVLDKNFAEN